MLVLSRKRNETVTIADDITVTVLEINGNRVRLGICAPRKVPVVRTELLELPYEPDAVDREHYIDGAGDA